MILTLDIGNTNIKTALFEGMEMRQYWRISTNRARSSDEYGIILMGSSEPQRYSRKCRRRHHRCRPSCLRSILRSSICAGTISVIEPMKIEPGVKTGINIKYENPREVGSDRIANAVAAYELYGGPCITIDFGTATTLRRNLRARRIPGRRDLPRSQARGRSTDRARGEAAALRSWQSRKR